MGPLEASETALTDSCMAQKCLVFVFFHFRESFVFSGFAWEGVLKPDIRDFRHFGKTTFLSGRSPSKSMIAVIFPHFM